MFTPLGKFSAIVPCPKGEECSLLNCLFSHKPGDQPTAENNLSVLPQIQDYEGQRTPKRIKVEQEPTEILMTDLKKSLNNVSRPPSRVDAVASPSASSSKPAEPAATPAPASVSAPASASASDGVSTKLPPPNCTQRES
ncbi:hypothetical protein N7468_004794 [Penicillium chermesinum]|uniref:Uncharacterized protein n=1 Tax=Penicillium chermesinum TaxID=63820 RepID=A0A9W9TSW2_9EURO|nr:uncharacterized protein N7468_004794 [Penicillium chermesinum]KAJ5240175.1 hypothetical protein N7468_004794 [Penicillium chermesinum]KAJ6167047.1 hypothetical protein N7470_002494 [Penicillium chermesinum]